LLNTRALSTPSSPFSSGGSAAAGERGRSGFDLSGFVAANVKLPRTSGYDQCNALRAATVAEIAKVLLSIDAVIRMLATSGDEPENALSGYFKKLLRTFTNPD
jgi:hypothetical protein